jgi:hypothetical protein
VSRVRQDSFSKKEMNAEGRWDFRYTGIRETERISGIQNKIHETT